MKEKVKELTPEQERKISLINKVVSAKVTADSVYDKLHAVMGLEPESALSRALFDPLTHMIELTSELIGDKDSWLSWYIWDNECGKKGFPASWEYTGRRGAKKRKSIRVVWPVDLLFMIELEVDASRKV